MGAAAQASIENEMDDSELSPADIAAFLDGTLVGEDRKRVEEHLSADPAARQELIKTSRIIASMPAARQKSSHRWIAPLGALAIAAAALLMIRPAMTSQSERLSTDRRPPQEPADHIELIHPATGGEIAQNEMTFVWRPHDGASYRFVISDESGQVLFDRSTSDTIVVVPFENLRNTTGKLYWAVDALVENGSTLSSRLSEFEVRSR
jgi:hypothetical protein